MGSKIWTIATCLALPVGILGSAAAHADTYAIYLSDATIVGAGATLTIRRLPLIYNGKTYYNDVTIPFTAVAPTASVGALVKAGAATGVTSPGFATSHFVAGLYKAPGGAADATFRVTGPGVGTAGTTVWSLAASAPDAYTPIANAQWTVGPLSDSPAVAAYIKTWSIPIDPNATYGFGSTTNGTIFLYAFLEVGATMTVHQYYENVLEHTYTFTYSSP